MSELVTIAFVYVLAGLILGVMMFLTASRIEHAATTTGQVLEVTIGQYSIKTTNVLVALAVLAFATMVAVPSYLLYSNGKIDDRQMNLTFRLQPPTGGPIEVTRDNSCVQRMAYLQLYKTRDPQVFTVTDAPYDPVNVRVKYDWAGHRPMVSINGSADAPVQDFDGASGTLPPIELTRQTIAPKLDGGANLSKPDTRVTQTQKALSDPPPIANNPATAGRPRP
ncbi:MAG TPA: hypothetical protein VGU66_10965 [Candidatus Elarobacter sp.]|nr:hypothetical protein [Candidatus Elarobacter sp.]